MPAAASAPRSRPACRRPWGTRSLALAASLALHGVLVAAGLWIGFDLRGGGSRLPPELALLSAPVALAAPQAPARLETVASLAPEPVLAELAYEPEAEVEVPLTWSWMPRRSTRPEGFRALPPRPAAAAPPAQAVLAEAPPLQAASASPVLASLSAAGYMPPRPLQGSSPAPDYPARALRSGQEGLVKLLVSVSAAGAPEEIEIEVSSGHAVLDQAALEAVRRWRFEPAHRDGQAVAGDIVVPIRFRLDRG